MAKIDDANFNPGTGESSYKPNTSDSNITPPRGAYASQGQFRFWCQKVLPLVYDDSLSYYELLCKVVDYLNKTMQNVAVLEQDVTDTNKAFSDLQDHMNEQVTEVDNQFANLQDYTNEQIENVRTAFNVLQQYVNDYYHSLDVQDEINKKLDQMAEDGTLDTIIKPYFDAYKSEIDEVMKQQNQTLTLQNEKINSQDARLDAIVAQAGTDNTEVVDARVEASKYGSKIAVNLGTAIREQINNSLGANLNGIISDKQLDDLDNAPLNTALFIYNDGTEQKAPAHYPAPWVAGSGGILLTISTTYQYGTTQILFDYSNALIYTRIKGSSAWLEWNDIAKQSLYGMSSKINTLMNTAIQGGQVLTTPSILSDLNDAEWGKIYNFYRYEDEWTPIKNYPLPTQNKGEGGVLFTLPINYNGLGCIQLFISIPHCLVLARVQSNTPKTFTSWWSIGDTYISSINTRLTPYLKGNNHIVLSKDNLDDIGNAPVNSALVIYNDGEGYEPPTGLPITWVTGAGGLLITVSSTGQSYGNFQSFLSFTDGIVYNRIKGTTKWLDWNNIISANYSKLFPKTYITVGNGKDYTNLIDALKYSTQHNNTTIEVFPGEYDFSTIVSDYPTGYYLSNNVTIKAHEGAKVICHLDEYNNGFAPFHLGAFGNIVVIDGLTIDCTNCRYNIHDEAGGGTNNGGVHIYKNMKFINNSTPDESIKHVPRALGVGVTGNERIEVINCIFDTKMDALHSCDFHTDWNGKQDVECTVIMNGCYDATSGFSFTEVPGTIKGINAYVSNCFTKYAPVVQQTDQVITLNSWNNVLAK